MIDPIKSLGIEKGRPFNPDATSRAALEAGARDAHDWLNYFYETGLHPYFEGTHWAVPAQMPFVEEAAKGYHARLLPRRCPRFDRTTLQRASR